MSGSTGSTPGAGHERLDELIAFRRHLHAHPELAYSEVETTELIATRLAAAGLEPRALSSGTGLWCDIGAGERCVALRADIDALAMHDTKTVPYRSQKPGVAHGCGHDVHTAVLVGVGIALAGATFDGRVRLIFEPAEETVPGGALGVIEDGCIDGVQVIFGLHCDPKSEVGRVGVRSGPLTSAADMIEVVLSGPGGHTARPELTVDLVAVAGRLAAELPVLVASRTGGALALVFGAIAAGDAPNVIPSLATLRGSVRTADIDAWHAARDVLRSALDDLLVGSGTDVQIHHTVGVPPVVNDDGAAALAASVVRSSFGPDALVKPPRSAGGDTFAWYLRHTKGCYLRLGVHDPALGDSYHDLHSGEFDVDERAIDVGVTLMTNLALAALQDDRLG